ncbi:MAG: hypothetical protein HRU13_04015 [Phycisphaerales bacterium]|nr:hypothetical protein [Phycisphaerales bacterium]
MSTTATREHVALVHPWVVDALLAGKKTIESRFSRDRRPPFDRVAKGDVVHFRVTGGGYAARAVVAKVECHDSLTPEKVLQIESDLRSSIGGEDEYWQAARSARCATLVHLVQCVGVEAGPRLDRQPGDRRAWFVLE